MPLGDVPSGQRTSSPSSRRFVPTTSGFVAAGGAHVARAGDRAPSRALSPLRTSAIRSSRTLMTLILMTSLGGAEIVEIEEIDIAEIDEIAEIAERLAWAQL